MDSSITIVKSEVMPELFDEDGLEMKVSIKKHLLYPRFACLERTVFVSCVVDLEGDVKDAEVKRGISKQADLEAIKVVRLVKFGPGKRIGEIVEMQIAIQVKFSL